MIASAPIEVATGEVPGLVGGRYRLGELIAIGGSAGVHRAFDVRLGRDVAIKRPRDGEAHARIRREAAILARCAHPDVVACLDAGEDAAGAPFVALQLVEGANLVQWAASAAIPRRVARTWAHEVIRAVRALHARGIVHGDLKPQHIMIGRDGHAILVDFDRAHGVDERSSASGIEAFAAPAVRAGGGTTVASDRFALGALLRWMREQAVLD